MKRSGSALQRQTKNTGLGKTFARMQIVKHLNMESGVQETIEKTVKLREHTGLPTNATDDEGCPYLVPIETNKLSEEQAILPPSSRLR